MKLKEILELENIKIFENNRNVLESGLINFDDIETSDNFFMSDYDIDYYDYDYDNSVITYSICQNSVTIKANLSEEEVKEFFKKLEEKYNN